MTRFSHAGIARIIQALYGTRRAAGYLRSHGYGLEGAVRILAFRRAGR